MTNRPYEELALPLRVQIRIGAFEFDGVLVLFGFFIDPILRFVASFLQLAKMPPRSEQWQPPL